MPNLIPIALTALGGLLTVVGTCWLALNTMRDGSVNRTANAKLLDTAQDAAARLGNDKSRQELIEARTKLLARGAGAVKSDIKSLIKSLPERANEYNRLSQDKVDQAKALGTDFDLCWGPLVKYTLAEFDRAVDELRKELGTEGNSIQLTKNDEFKLTAVYGSSDDGPGHPTLRSVSFGSVHLYVSYTRAVLRPEGMSDAELNFGFTGDGMSAARGISENPFTLRMGSSNGSTDAGEGFMKPIDGIPPQHVIDQVRAGIIRTLDRFMVIARATRKDREVR